MTCPHCDVPLTVSHRQSVEIDLCPQCRGVWLDRGELDKIIERYDAYEDRRDPKAFRQNHAPRRNSFWHELFD